MQEIFYWQIFPNLCWYSWNPGTWQNGPRKIETGVSCILYLYLTHLPKALTNSFTDTPCSSAGRGWVTSLRDDLGDPEAGDLVVEAGDAVWAEMSILEGDRNPGEAERLPGMVETLLRSLCIGVLSKLDPKPPPNCGMLGFPKLGMTDPLNKSRNY